MSKDDTPKPPFFKVIRPDDPSTDSAKPVVSKSSPREQRLPKGFAVFSPADTYVDRNAPKVYSASTDTAPTHVRLEPKSAGYALRRMQRYSEKAVEMHGNMAALIQDIRTQISDPTQPLYEKMSAYERLCAVATIDCLEKLDTLIGTRTALGKGDSFRATREYVQIMGDIAVLEMKVLTPNRKICGPLLNNVENLLDMLDTYSKLKCKIAKEQSPARNGF